jgi:hypothetical protein
MGALAKEVPGLIESIGKGVDKLATGAVTAGINSLVGGPSGKPIAFQTTGTNGEVINVATDGTKSIMYADGTVKNFDKAGNVLAGTGDEGVTPASPPPSDGMTEQDLYNQQYYQNYYDSYNPYEGYDMNEYEP